VVHIIDKGKAYSYERNVSSSRRGYYIRSMTARVQLKKIKELFVNLKGLGTKTNCQS
jgi:hypothetical protein